MKISKYIGDLLYEYECIVIPDFGGFIAKERSSKINTVQSHFSPPSKEIVFNVHLKTNDGLLVNHIARSEKISYTDARLAVENFVNRCHQEIEKGRRIHFQKVGKIFSDEEGNLQFEPDSTQNYLSDSFGLKSFISPPIKRSNIRPLNVKKPKDRSEAVPKKKKKSEKTYQAEEKNKEPKYIRINISAILIIVALSAVIYLKYGTIKDYYNEYASFIPYFSTPNEFLITHLDELPLEKMIALDQKMAPNRAAKMKEEMISYIDMNSSDSTFTEVKTDDVQEDKKEAQSLPVESVNTKLSQEEEQPEEIVKGTSNERISSNEQKPQQGLILTDSDAENMESVQPEYTPVTASPQPKYYIVAGSFNDMVNAESKVRELISKGFDAAIIGQNKYGSYRVCFNSFVNLSEAKQQLAIIRKDENASAWMLSI